MKLMVEFTSTSFPPYQNEEDEINPGVYGRRLAEYIQEKMLNDGFESSKIVSEDWGWIIKFDKKEFPVIVGCTADVEQLNRFLVIATASSPWSGLFKRSKVASCIKEVEICLNRILSSEDTISDVNWIQKI